MSRLDSLARIALSLPLSLEASRSVDLFKAPEAKRRRSRTLRKRPRIAGMTAIIPVLPRSSVDLLDGLEFRHGMRERGQVVEQLLARRSSAQQAP